MVNRLCWMRERFPWQPGERALQKTSINFVDSITETLGPLVSGAQLQIVTEETVHDLHALWNVIRAQAITRLVLVPSLLNALVHSVRPGDGHSLRLVVSSGEALLAPLAAAAQEILGDVTILNLYGSSEVAGDVSYHVCSKHPATSGGVPLGRPVANTQLYLLDAFLQPVPFGVAAELHVGGAHLARGYWGRQDLTAQRFIIDPFSVSAGPRLFKTGDLARYLPNGELEYLGRLDDQVKVRGFRIELGEIEGQLASYTEVDAAVVLACDDLAGQKRLVAYLTRYGDPVVESAAFIAGVKAYMQERLPEYMVPGQFVILDALPLNPNGKVDKKALPVPVAPALSGDFAAPGSETEINLLRIWANLLRLPAEQISATASFFSLGGHSLLVMRLIFDVKNTFGIELHIKKIFELGTISRIGGWIDHAIEHDMIAKRFRLIDTNSMNEIEI
jgi:acyl-coenzyme A synthetase/AMP-(fatty) acid ligase/acyl carrier protein